MLIMDITWIQLHQIGHDFLITVHYEELPILSVGSAVLIDKAALFYYNIFRRKERTKYGIHY